MRSHSLLLSVVFLLTWSATTHPAFAGGYWRFYISVDGKPACTGGIGVSGDDSHLDHLESSLRGGVQLGTDSFLDETTTGDITLTGDVVFRDQEHAPVHLQQLRLVYEPDTSDRSSGTYVAGGYYDWRLHPDDAASIMAHYRHDAKVATAIRLAKPVGVTLVVTVLTVWAVVRRRKKTPHPQNRALVPI